MVEQTPQVRDLLRTASRNRLAPETVTQLLQAAQTSIGLRQAEDVVQRQLVSILDFRQTLREQIEHIEQELEQRIKELQSPLLSLGISSTLAATIHAETDPIGDFRTPDQYVAYAGLDPSLHESGDTVHWRGNPNSLKRLRKLKMTNLDTFPFRHLTAYSRSFLTSPP